MNVCSIVHVLHRICVIISASKHALASSIEWRRASNHIFDDYILVMVSSTNSMPRMRVAVCYSVLQCVIGVSVLQYAAVRHSMPAFLI